MSLRFQSGIHNGITTTDGEGVHLTRIIGSPELNMHDPFLLLDEFKSNNPNDYLGGFPDHPHRGFETVTYMLEGKIRHKDNAGHGGVVSPGGVQWMTAGRGVIHSEFPEQENGLLWGIQLWLNLPAEKKMIEPNYQEFDKNQIPEENRDSGATVKVISGRTSLNTQGPITNIDGEQLFFIIELDKTTEFKEPIATNLDAILYVFDGTLTLNGHQQTCELSKGTLAVLGSGDELYLSTVSTTARCLLVAAKPLNEPVARGGPFVMNTKAEVIQANRDFQAGKF